MLAKLILPKFSAGNVFRKILMCIEGNQQNFDKITKLSKGAKFRRNERNQQKFVQGILQKSAKTATSQKLSFYRKMIVTKIQLLLQTKRCHDQQKIIPRKAARVSKEKYPSQKLSFLSCRTRKTEDVLRPPHLPLPRPHRAADARRRHGGLRWNPRPR